MHSRVISRTIFSRGLSSRYTSVIDVSVSVTYNFQIVNIFLTHVLDYSPRHPIGDRDEQDTMLDLRRIVLIHGRWDVGRLVMRTGCQFSCHSQIGQPSLTGT